MMRKQTVNDEQTENLWVEINDKFLFTRCSFLSCSSKYLQVFLAAAATTHEKTQEKI